MYEKITPENVLMFAIRNYTNPHCEGEKEFEDDLHKHIHLENNILFKKGIELEQKLQEK